MSAGSEEMEVCGILYEGAKVEVCGHLCKGVA